MLRFITLIDLRVSGVAFCGTSCHLLLLLWRGLRFQVSNVFPRLGRLLNMRSDLISGHKISLDFDRVFLLILEILEVLFVLQILWCCLVES